MPCYRCGARQVDPDRGQSPWKRGVRGDQQVLVCPVCQAAHDWMADLDHCPQCGSTRLLRRLGEVECRDCGHVPALEDSGHLLAEIQPGAAPGLAEEVSRALERVLGRQAGARVSSSRA